MAALVVRSLFCLFLTSSWLLLSMQAVGARQLVGSGAQQTPLRGHPRSLQQIPTPGTFQPASDGPGYSDLYTKFPNTDIDNNNLLTAGNPFKVNPAPECYSEGIIVSSAAECVNFCTEMTDIAVQGPSIGADPGAVPCLGVAYVSSHPPGTSLPPIGCCFPKASRAQQQPSGQKPGVDSYTANAKRLANTDMPGADILSPSQQYQFENALFNRPSSDPLYSVNGLPGATSIPVLSPNKCFGVGAVATYASECVAWCAYWNENPYGAPSQKCVGVTYVSSLPSTDINGCCFLKYSTETTGVGGSKVGVDSYVPF